MSEREYGSLRSALASTRMEGFANSFGDSGASAASVMAAQNLGAGKRNGSW